MEAGTIWLLLATALVLFMTPGVAFFYGGLVKAQSVVSMMMLSFGAFAL
ncbi:MAG TPA: ammonia channel protein, partial [Aeromicrobium sp.]|nr:ammonia channel protein [Aeromicrobium sp.]